MSPKPSEAGLAGGPRPAQSKAVGQGPPPPRQPQAAKGAPPPPPPPVKGRQQRVDQGHGSQERHLRPGSQAVGRSGCQEVCQHRSVCRAVSDKGDGSGARQGHAVPNPFRGAYNTPIGIKTC